MKFNTAEEMLDEIQSGTDLCNPKIGGYVFLYNEAGSIAEYTMIREDMRKLAREAAELGEEWMSLLGPGGYIYDDPSYEYFNKNATSNLQWCEEHYMEDGWITCSEFEKEM